MTIPKTMRAVEITQPGGPEVLKIGTRPVPQPKPGEVLIRVAAAGVNRPDTMQRAGNYPVPPGASDIPGLELAGSIVATGDGVRDWRVGLFGADLLKALREGKTLGEIAPTIAGKNKVDLVASITTAANAKIDKAVTDGKLTADQATALKAQVGPAVTALVDRKLPTAIGRLPTLNTKP